ncbi:MAG: hypothetical protein WCG25_03250 [bacterium]
MHSTSDHLVGYFLLSCVYNSNSYIKLHFNLPHLHFSLSMSLHSKFCNMMFSISTLGKALELLQQRFNQLHHAILSVSGDILIISLAQTWNRNIFFHNFSLSPLTNSVKTYLSSE